MKKIKINYIEDLEKLRNLNNFEYYISLERNLDFENKLSYEKEEKFFEYLTQKTKEGFIPINIKAKTFIFNGNNNTISNMVINMPNENNVGLFKCVNNDSIIKNLNLSNSYIEGKYKVGSFAGSLDGQIHNCSFNGIVKGNMIIGGFVGESNNNCYFSNNSIIATLNGNSFIGGILGKGERCVFINNDIQGEIVFKNDYDYQSVGEIIGCGINVFILEKEIKKKYNIINKITNNLILK